jgi:hypothetical protein
VKGVDVLQTGRNPFALSGCSDIEFRDSRFDQGWWTDVGQGTAYIAFGGGTTDCLLDSIQGIDLRHGPNAQNSANGNVVRNAWLPGLDAQWHMSWAYDNLYESCIIDARRLATRLQPSINTGTYGYAIYAQHGRSAQRGLRLRFPQLHRRHVPGRGQ